MLEIRIIPHGSSQYAEACALRQKCLRTPLGLTLNPKDLDNEVSDKHFGLWESSRLVACLVVTPLRREEVKLRQMCVEEDWRGQGIGKRLIEATEAHLSKFGTRKVELSARVAVCGFYKRLGYRATGVPFIEVTIEHIKMVKFLLKKT